jgi:menaquinone-specific isochorismate synthase
MNALGFSGGAVAWLARRDGTVVFGHGPFRSAATPPADGVAFFVSDFQLQDSEPWRIPSRHQVLSSGDFARLAAAEATINHAGTPTWQPPEAAGFAVVFQEILHAIDHGVMEKTVPVVTEHGTSNGNPATVIAPAMATMPLPLQSYGWLEGDTGFAGATPELLFSIDGSSLETMALAGTARSEDQDAFAADEKEIREHEFVATTLVDKLTTIGKVNRSPRETLHLGPIVHFHSPIKVRLHHPGDPLPLIRLLHPTPALGPLPRNHTTLAQLADWRRRLNAPPAFGAPFGVSHNGRFEAVVAIRGIWWNAHSLMLPSGCGVIQASRLVNEWRELRLKREAVRGFLC